MPTKGMDILLTARTLIGTPYAKMDCSHFVNKAYVMSGLKYPYTPTSSFGALKQYFKEVASPDSGDVILFKGHMGLYDPTGCMVAHTAECKRLGNNAPVLSARSVIIKSIEYGRSNFFLGTPRYFRWKEFVDGDKS